MNQAVILAAGISSRTQGIGRNIPKPMLPLGGKPAMEYVVNSLHLAGVDDLIVTLHYQPQQIVNYFGDGSRFGVSIRYSYEPQRLDTAGSLRFIYDLLEAEFLVCGGHFYLPNLNLGTMIKFHEYKCGVGTVAFCTMENDLLQSFGQAILDEERRLRRFEEKPLGVLNNLVHTTYQIYRKEAIGIIPLGRSLSIPKYLIPQLLAHDMPIYGYLVDCPLISVSTPALYERATRLIGVYSEKGVT